MRMIRIEIQMKTAFFEMQIFLYIIWPKDHLCRIWGKNIRLGVRYGCECNVLRDGSFLHRESYRTPDTHTLVFRFFLHEEKEQSPLYQMMSCSTTIF